MPGLSAAELRALKDVGRHSRLGRLFRRHWLPVLSEARLPPPDGPPVRLRVLNEYLVLFRDTAGRLGVIEGYCPHEGGSLAMGRNAEGGLQCMLHGWKFDVEGRRVDSGAAYGPPARATAYPTVVSRGRLWIYMGLPEEMPSPPE